jgi:hypothetical protein
VGIIMSSQASWPAATTWKKMTLSKPGHIQNSRYYYKILLISPQEVLGTAELSTVISEQD